MLGSVISNSDGSVFGVVKNSQFALTIDAAFITTVNQTITSTLNNTNRQLNTDVTTNFFVGQWVGKAGSKTGITTGKVTGVNVSTLLYDNTIPVPILLNDLIETDYKSTGGDSGSVAFSGEIGNYDTAGIHNGGNDTNKYFTKASTINSQFGLTRY